MTLGLVLAACGLHRPAVARVDALPALAEGEDTVRVLLIGDAGVRRTAREHADAPGSPRTWPGSVPAGVAAAARGRCADASDPCVVVLLGDNLYPRGVGNDRDRAWLDRFADAFAPVPVVLVLGNHDAGPVFPSDARARRELDWAATHTWSGASRNWVLRVGPLDLFGVDTDWFVRGPGRCGVGASTCASAVGLAGTLRAAARSEAPFTVVVGHHPVESLGERHGSAGAYRDSGFGAFRGAAVRRLAEAIGADAWIGGHEHLLQAVPSAAAFGVGASGKIEDGPPAVQAGTWAVAEPGYGLLTASREVLRLELVPCGGSAPACFVSAASEAGWQAVPCGSAPACTLP